MEIYFAGCPWSPNWGFHETPTHHVSMVLKGLSGGLKLSLHYAGRPDPMTIIPFWEKTRLEKFREALFSWHNGDQLRAPLKPLATIGLCDVRGLEGSLNRASMMPRVVSLSGVFFQNGEREF